jgi:hypothetical protein
MFGSSGDKVKCCWWSLQSADRGYGLHGQSASGRATNSLGELERAGRERGGRSERCVKNTLEKRIVLVLERNGKILCAS